MVRISQLRYVEAILETGSFHGAATALGVSQPTVSQQVQRLEEELDLVLVTRTRGRVSATAEAQLLLPIIRRILEEDRNLRDEASAIRGLRIGTLRIGAITSISRLVLTRALPAYRQAFPGVRFKVAEGGSLMIMELVQAGKLDVGFISRAQDEPIEAGLAATDLFTDQAALCVPRGHPAVHRGRVQIGDLAHEHWIGEGADYSMRKLLVRLAGDIKLNIVYESNSANTTLHLVAAGIGVALVGKLSFLSSDLRDRKRVVLLPIDAPEIALSLITRRDAMPPRAVLELRRFLDPPLRMVREQLTATTITQPSGRQPDTGRPDRGRTP